MLVGALFGCGSTWVALVALPSTPEPGSSFNFATIRAVSMELKVTFKAGDQPVALSVLGAWNLP